MPLSGSDFNLILPLKVLLEERNVTRAGQRLNLGQPAMSAALARLRRRFDDELLVRAGRDYELTPLASDLLPEAQRAVRLMGVALRVGDEFEPRTSRRTFRLAMSDYAIAVVHEPLVRIVQAEAPGVRLSIGPLGPDALTSDRVLTDNDVVIAPLGFGFPGVSRPMWRDRMVVLADRDNPRLVTGRMILKDLAELPHAVTSFGPGIVTPPDRVFGELGIERHVALQVYGFLPLLFAIEGTERIALIPELLARMRVSGDGRLVTVQPPFGDVILSEGYWFEENRSADPANRWLMGCLDAVGDELSRRPAG